MLNKDSLLVIAPTAASSAKEEAATDEDNEGVDDIKENIATSSAEILIQLQAKDAGKCRHSQQGQAAVDVLVDIILKILRNSIVLSLLYYALFC